MPGKRADYFLPAAIVPEHIDTATHFTYLFAPRQRNGILARNGFTMILLAWIRRLYKILSADASPTAIACGIAFGLVLGCVPLGSGIGIALLLAALIFRLQVSSAMMAMAVAKLLIALGAAAAFVPMGSIILESNSLKPIWSTALNWPVVAWLDLDCLGVTGGLAIGIIMGTIAFWPVRQAVVSYRRCIHEKVAQNRFFQAITNFWFIKGLRFIFIGGEAMA
jgi:uncharacterized protein (TIGR03546 family)